MFKVKNKKYGTTLTVYATRQENFYAPIEFLVYQHRWLWISSEGFEPYPTDDDVLRLKRMI